MSGIPTDSNDGPSRPSPIDVYVGSRIRLRRTLLGMSQERLGDALGLTFQQIQKYERGTNRVGASRLFDLAHVLGVEIGFFYDEMPEGTRSGKLPADADFPMAAAPSQAGVAEPKSGFNDDMLHRRETLELVRTYYRITDPVMRRKVFDLIKTMVPKGGA
jgi:transcriptional regulator with XRE-family HTH domain